MSGALKIALGLASLRPNAQTAEDACNDLFIQMGTLVKEYNRRIGILQSPNGHFWKISVSNAGVLSTTDLGTNLP